MKSLVLATLAVMVTSEPVLQAREAQITARAVFDFGDMNLHKRQANQCFSANYTPCPDGTGCCPNGAGCFSSNGVGLCSVTCGNNQPQCNFNGISACCGIGEVCGGSMCIPAAATSTTATSPTSVTATPTSTIPVTSSSTLNISGLTTIPLPTNSFSFPSSSSTAHSACAAPSVYCSWPAMVVSASVSAVTYSAMEGCCAGGCNTKTPGICLPTTVTSVSVVQPTGSQTTGPQATVTHAGGNRLAGNAWMLGIGAILLGL